MLLKHITNNQSRGSSVSMVTRLTGWTTGVRFLFPAKCRLAPGPLSLLSNAYSGLFSPGERQLECAADHSPHSSAEIKNVWSYSSTTHTSWRGA